MEVLASRAKKFIDKVYDIILLEDKKTLVIILKDRKPVKEIKKDFKEYSLKFLDLDDLLTKKELLDILYEGFSLKYNKALSRKAGFEPLILITYSLENLDHIKKTIFGYALKGRSKDRGLLGTINGTVIGRNSLLVPMKNFHKIKEFLEHWKVAYKTKKIIEIG